MHHNCTELASDFFFLILDKLDRVVVELFTGLRVVQNAGPEAEAITAAVRRGYNQHTIPLTMPESLLLQDDITDYESDYESSIKSDIEVDLYDTVDAVESVSTRLKVRSTNSEETTSDWTYDPSESRYMLVQERIGIPQIRETQARVLSLLLAGKSVLLLARTGWGKSLIFQGLIHMMPADSRRYITIIFVPLSGLAQEQVAELNERGRKLGATTDEAIFYDKTKLADRHLDDIKQGRYKWVFLSPEKALHLGVFKQLWENSDFRSKVLLLAVDEAHLVSEWYVISSLDVE